MPHLEPTYLRYIYDGLEKGDLHPDNAAALPDGITGLYEAAFEESKPARERQKLLETYAIWALLKKEVSAQFVAEILEMPTQEIVDFIASYSSWFTSPESGKYQLYHERLKVYLLQKLSEQEIAVLHDKLVIRLEHAILEQKQDEFELYELEFLSVHYLTTAMLTGDGKKLIALSYDQNHWQRQLKLSKGFEWTKKGLKQVMTWASKFNDEEVIECGLQMVNLHHQEQNDAPQIVALVAEGDIDAALKRIEAFGGNDKEGLQRKFILYMLCLMELTLLESKEKPFRKVALEKILKHFDENIPVDHSVLNWYNFFSSYLMFQMAYEFAKLGLDYLIFYKRTDRWEFNWICEKGPFSDLQYQVLKEVANEINFYHLDSSVLNVISAELFKQGKIEEAVSMMQESLACARGISNDYNKTNSLAVISTEMAKQGKQEVAASIMQESLACVQGISDEKEKSRALPHISTELAKQGKLEESSSLLQEALEYTRGISDESDKCSSLSAISTELAKQGKLEEAESVIQEAIENSICIKKEFDKWRALNIISTELAIQGKVEEALKFTLGISDDFWKMRALIAISTKLVSQGKIQEALECARGISDESYNIMALSAISTKLTKQGKVKDAESVMLEALEYARGISNQIDKNSILDFISTELSKQGKVKEALKYARGISEESKKFSSINVISDQLAIKGKLEEVVPLILETLERARGINDEMSKSIALSAISADLTKQENLEAALVCSSVISNKSVKISALSAISTELAKQGKVDKALEFARGLNFDNVSDVLTKSEETLELYDYWKSLTLKAISTEMNKQGMLEEALSLIREALEIAQSISSNYWKRNILLAISTELVRQGEIQEALECARGISDESYNILALSTISTELTKQGKFKDGESIMLEALKQARCIINEFEKCSALSAISSELAKQGKIDQSNSEILEALKCARGISNDNVEIRALSVISTELAKMGNWYFAEEIALEIRLIAKRQNCWKKIASAIKEKEGWQSTIENLEKLQNQEGQTYYFKGLLENLNPLECNTRMILNTRRYYLDDIESLQLIFQQYALHETFFGRAKKKKLDRYNRTLNIQWAIDIKNQLPN